MPRVTVRCVPRVLGGKGPYNEGNEKVQDSLPICFGHPKELSAALADPSTISGLPWSARHNILPGQLEKLSSMSSLPRQE